MEIPQSHASSSNQKEFKHDTLDLSKTAAQARKSRYEKKKEGLKDRVKICSRSASSCSGESLRESQTTSRGGHSSVGIVLKDFRGSHELNGHQQLMLQKGDTVVIDHSKFNIIEEPHSSNQSQHASSHKQKYHILDLSSSTKRANFLNDQGDNGYP